MVSEVTLFRPDGSSISAAEIENVRQTSDSRYPVTTRVRQPIRTIAGSVITPDTSLTISAVWACVRFLTQGIAKLPWYVKMEQGPINSEVQWSHPVNYLLGERPSPEWSSFAFRETMLSWVLRWGNAYAEIERAIDGRAIALWPIEPWRVEVMRDQDRDWQLFYRVRSDIGGTVDLDPEDVFHVRGYGEGPVGLSVMAYAAQSLGWAKAAQLFGAGFFGHGAQLAGVVKMKKTLSPQALAELRTDFQKLYGGPTRSNNVAFLDNEMDYQSIAIDPEKGQFIETNEFLLDDVCRWFGVPPHKVYNLKRATFSNIEHQSIEVVEDSLRPWAKRFECEADYKLFGQNRRGLYTEMNFRQLLRPDTKTRMEYYQGMRNMGAFNVDEIRDFEGENEIGAAAGGKKYTMQAGFTTLEKIGEDPPPAPAPAPAPEPADEPEGESDPENPQDAEEVDAMVESLVILGLTKFIAQGVRHAAES